MCDEGFNLEKYLGEVRRILKPGGSGKMILVSRKLTSSMKKFLLADVNEDGNEKNDDVSNNETETDHSFRNGLRCNLDTEGKSNARVSFSAGESMLFSRLFIVQFNIIMKEGGRGLGDEFFILSPPLSGWSLQQETPSSPVRLMLDDRLL